MIGVANALLPLTTSIRSGAMTGAAGAGSSRPKPIPAVPSASVKAASTFIWVGRMVWYENAPERPPLYSCLPWQAPTKDRKRKRHIVAYASGSRD